MTIASTLSGNLAVKHPTLGLLCREDGAILNRTCGRKSFAWTFGFHTSSGYLQIRYNGKYYLVHRLIAEAFLPNKEHLLQVDHIDRDKTNNAVSNLRWATVEENLRNRAVVDRSIEVYGVRYCEDRRAYAKSHGSHILVILNSEGKLSRTGYLTDDVYNELKPLSTKERAVRYYALKQNR